MKFNDINTFSAFLPSQYTGGDFTEEIWIRINSFSDDDVILFNRENCYGIIISSAGLVSLQWYDLTGTLSTEATAFSFTLATNTYVSLIRDETTQVFYLKIDGVLIKTTSASTLNVHERKCI